MPALSKEQTLEKPRSINSRSDYQTRIETLKDIITESNSVVFFGGAGVSTESGIPDFRSVNGLYSQKYAYPPEIILSHSFYAQNPEAFYQFYRNKVLLPALDAKPNAAHLSLARLEADGLLNAIITQNIDGLHQKAGAKRVLELHGSIHRNYCERCRSGYTAKEVLDQLEDNKLPRCKKPGCSGTIKPDVVLYEEQLDDKILDAAIASVSEAEVLIIGGTSLAVNPAAGLVNLFSKESLIVINRDITPRDTEAKILFRENIGKVLGDIYA